jgi:chromosome segregation ATPase
MPPEVQTEAQISDTLQKLQLLLAKYEQKEKALSEIEKKLEAQTIELSKKASTLVTWSFDVSERLKRYEAKQQELTKFEAALREKEEKLRGYSELEKTRELREQQIKKEWESINQEKENIDKRLKELKNQEERLTKLEKTIENLAVTVHQSITKLTEKMKETPQKEQGSPPPEFLQDISNLKNMVQEISHKLSSSIDSLGILQSVISNTSAQASKTSDELKDEWAKFIREQKAREEEAIEEIIEGMKTKGIFSAFEKKFEEFKGKLINFEQSMGIITEINRDLKSLNEKINAISGNLFEQKEQTVTNLLTTLDNKIKQLTDMETQLVEKLAQIEEKAEAINKKEVEVAYLEKLKEEVANQKAALDETAKKLEAKEKELLSKECQLAIDAQDMVRRAFAQKEEALRHKEAKLANIQRMEQEVAQREKKVEESILKLSEREKLLEEQIKQLTQTRKEAENALRIISSRIQELEQREMDFAEKLSQVIELGNRTLIIHEKEFKEANDKLAELQSTIKTMQTMVQELETRKSEAESYIKDAVNRKEMLQAEAAALEQKIANLNELLKKYKEKQPKNMSP